MAPSVIALESARSTKLLPVIAVVAMFDSRVAQDPGVESIDQWIPIVLIILGAV